MIKRVRLEWWKAFPSLDVSLLAGTSFIVAKNGIGKTSLLQAMQFGLFGDRHLLGSGALVEHAVRGDSDNARVILDVDLKGVSWNINRTVPRNLKPRDALPAAVVTADGREATDQVWQKAFSVASGVSLDELRLLSAIGEGGTLGSVADGQYDLVRHLSDVLGVTRMQGAAKELRSRAKVTSRSADQERLSKRDRPKRLLEAEYESLIQRQGEAQERLNGCRARVAELDIQLERLRAWEAWQARQAEESSRQQVAQAEIATLLDRAGQLTATAKVDAHPANALDLTPVAILHSAQVAEQSVLASTEQAAERLGAVKALAIGSQQALDDLRRGEGLCPTCLRAMTATEVSTAVVGHESDLAAAHSEQAELETRLQVLREIGGALRSGVNRLQAVRISPPPDESPPDGVGTADLLPDVAAARSALDSADEAARDLAASLRLQAAAVAAESADEALSRRLQVQYREADLGEVAAATMEGLAQRVCSEQIAPLAQVLAKRWLDLWPGRPTVGLDITSGKIFADHESTRLDLSDLSGGERTVASVLLRLLALQAASKSPILLLDEPLEHLDPRNRRMLAGVLVAAGKATAAPRQILVTTYEESVTRRLSDATGSPSHVLHIRPGPHV